MPDASQLLVFSGAALVLLVVPGPAVLYIVARSAAQGRRAGLVSVAGIHTGTLVHILAAVVGLSAVITASAAAFTAVKLAGAAYLAWLGIQAWRSSGDDAPADRLQVASIRSTRKLYVDGLILNVLNPKTAVFFLAFVPQFVDPNRGAAPLQLVVLGGLFIVLGVLSDGAYALAGAGVGSRWRRSAGRRRTRRLTGSIYVGLGAVTALSGEADA